MGFGVLLTLFSSFGQTFLISVFVPRMLGDLSLNEGQFGMLYALATLSSAACLPYFGRFLDRVSLTRYTLMVGVGLAAACWLVALSPNIPMLFLGILGLRLNGQGLLTLTASTAMARAFTDLRGRALSLSGVGYPVGESILPFTVLALIDRFGWRVSWGMLGGVICLVLLPLVVFLLRDYSDVSNVALGREATAGSGHRPVTQARVLRDVRFYLLLPGALTVPFVLTGVFLYQLTLAEFKGWTAAVIAGGFVVFAVVRLVSLLVGGPVIDKVGALRLFPFSLLPLSLGVGVLAVFKAPLAAYCFFMLAGLSQGVSSAVMTAVWTELYGRDAIGQVKSLTAMITVFSTALSPVVFGWLLAHQVSFGHILPALALLCLCATVISVLSRLWMTGSGVARTQTA